jgi:hypothetical protein
MLFWDLNFGIEGGEEWDEHHTSGDELTIVLKQFKAINHKVGHVVVLCCSWRHTDEITEALEEANYRDIQPVFWHKPDQNQTGDPLRFTQAVEVFIVANNYADGSKKNVQKTMDDNPMARHNIFEAKNTRIFRKYPDGQVVNHHQKPEHVIQFFLQRFAKPQDSVIVVGAGAGGDVLGANAAGFHVVALEREPKQFSYLRGFLTTYTRTEQKKGDPEVPTNTPEPACPFCAKMGANREHPLVACQVCDQVVCKDCSDEVKGIKFCMIPLCTPNGEKWKAKKLPVIVLTSDHPGGPPHQYKTPKDAAK